MGKRVTRKVSDQTKARMRAAKLKSKNPMWKKHHSATTKRRISESLLRYWQHIPKT